MAAYGSQADMLARLKSLIPPDWFPYGQTPVLDTVLAGPAAAMAAAYSLLAWVRAQMRLATSTGGMLDLFSYDFFGPSLLRRSGETDAAYQARISANLLQPRNTRDALITVLAELTGRTPVVFEPQRPLDTGGLGIGATMGLGVAGQLGSYAIPYQLFVIAYRPQGMGVPLVMGLGGTGITTATGGLNQGRMTLVPAGSGASIITDADIYAMAAAVMPAGTIAWVQIQN